MKHVPGLLVAIFVIFSTAAQAQEIEDQYLHVISLADEASSLKTSGKLEPALAKYKEALRALQILQRTYPRWNMNMVSFRMNDLMQNIEELSNKGPAPTPGASTSVSDSRVKLLEPGAEPRKALRLHPKAGDQQNLQMMIKASLAIKFGDVLDQAIKIPAMDFTLATTVKTTAENGDITYELRVVDATIVEDQEVMPQLSEPLKAALEKMKGLTGTATISSLGLGKKIDFKAPEGEGPRAKQTIEDMKQSFTDFLVPLPAEPIGVGAKWEVKLPIQANGIKIDQTTVYELSALEGESLTIKSSITQTAAKQKLEILAMKSMKLDLEKMDGQGTGGVKVELSKIVGDGTVTSHSDISAAMNAGDQKQSLTMKMDAKLTITSK